MPELFKRFFVCPIYKGGTTSLLEKYRPIALTSHIIKIQEKSVRNMIKEYLEANNLLSESQHGFREGRSCLSNLVTHYGWLLNILATGQNVDVFLDFPKAFEEVDHGMLGHTLRKPGIAGRLGVCSTTPSPT